MWFTDITYGGNEPAIQPGSGCAEFGFIMLCVCVGFFLLLLYFLILGMPIFGLARWKQIQSRFCDSTIIIFYIKQKKEIFITTIILVLSCGYNSTFYDQWFYLLQRCFTPFTYMRYCNFIHVITLIIIIITIYSIRFIQID